jgi:hypothetical protein
MRIDESVQLAETTVDAGEVVRESGMLSNFVYYYSSFFRLQVKLPTCPPHELTPEVCVYYARVPQHGYVDLDCRIVRPTRAEGHHLSICRPHRLFI